VKYIRKTTEPENFLRWKNRNRGANWNDFSQTAEHGELRDCLIEEQQGMCCYCEVMISSKDSHIEHLKPKGSPSYRKEMFSYGNLLASCQYKDSCVIRKFNWYEPEMVSPLDENCADRFTYTSDGRIIPSDKQDKWAEETIEKLCLNCPRLKDRRRSIINALDPIGKGPDPTYLKALVKEMLEGKDNWPHGFYTLLLYLAEDYDIVI
jgi:uncharacterized protein (TIGR02646 family)